MLDSLLFLLLAHGADPRPISLDEATANIVKFVVTIMLALMMSYPVLAPLFPNKDEDEPPRKATESQSGLVGWIALGLLLVFSMGWWLMRTSIVELTTKEVPKPEHAHTQERGGQIGMWSDFHAEVSRIESGEVRVYLTDSYNRPIAARFFDAEITPFKTDGKGGSAPSPPEQAPEALATATPTLQPSSIKAPTPKSAVKTAPEEVPGHPTLPALNETYRFARLGLADRSYRVTVKTPGWSVKLKFIFDESSGRRSLPIWCGNL